MGHCHVPARQRESQQLAAPAKLVTPQTALHGDSYYTLIIWYRGSELGGRDQGAACKRSARAGLQRPSKEAARHCSTQRRRRP